MSKTHTSFLKGLLLGVLVSAACGARVAYSDFDLVEQSCSTLSTAGHARICADSATHTLKVSQNGNAYMSCSCQ